MNNLISIILKIIYEIANKVVVKLMKNNNEIEYIFSVVLWSL